MFKLKSRLLVVILVVGSLTVMWSCSQREDITAPKSLTKVWLSPERLPTPVDGMVYELWASKVAFPSISDASQVRSFGRFSHIISDTLVGFLDEDGKDRADSNEFSMEGDLFAYSYLFVSVEVDSLDDGLPGPMVVGQAVTGSTDTVRMYFPKQDSLWNATMRCNFETPTDDNYYNDGFGLWFCSHTTETIVITDTLDATVTYTLDTIEPIISETTGDTLNLTDLRKAYADSVWYVFDTVRLDFGRDTLALGIDGYIHYGAKQKILYKAGTDVPRIYRVPHADLVTEVQWVNVDVFSQDLFGLPDVSDYGWKYKGWVIFPILPSTAVGTFSPPAWDFTSDEYLFPGYQDGGLLTTGTFADERDVDDSDPFTLEVAWDVDSTFYDTVSLDPLEIDTVIETFSVLKRPRFPGEDFLDTLALDSANGGTTFRPSLLNWPGTVFLSFEPDNMITDKTNFPLIPFGRAIPLVGFESINIRTLINFAGGASGAPGLPKIEAKIQRF